MHLIDRVSHPYKWGQRERANRTVKEATGTMQTMKLIPLAIAAASLVVVVAMALSVPAHSSLMAVAG
jgi:hypothetical protein